MRHAEYLDCCRIVVSVAGDSEHPGRLGTCTANGLLRVLKKRLIFTQDAQALGRQGPGQESWSVTKQPSVR